MTGGWIVNSLGKWAGIQIHEFCQWLDGRICDLAGIAILVCGVMWMLTGNGNKWGGRAFFVFLLVAIQRVAR